MPIYKSSHLGYFEGKQPLWDLPTMFINHLLIWMILQVEKPFLSKN